MSDHIVVRPIGERVASLETEVAYIKSQNEEIIGKLDSLIEIKNKGAGAFLLISALFGTSALAAVYYVLSLLHIRV